MLFCHISEYVCYQINIMLCVNNIYYNFVGSIIHRFLGVNHTVERRPEGS